MNFPSKAKFGVRPDAISPQKKIESALRQRYLISIYLFETVHIHSKVGTSILIHDSLSQCGVCQLSDPKSVFTEEKKRKIKEDENRPPHPHLHSQTRM